MDPFESNEDGGYSDSLERFFFSQDFGGECLAALSQEMTTSPLLLNEDELDALNRRPQSCTSFRSRLIQRCVVSAETFVEPSTTAALIRRSSRLSFELQSTINLQSCFKISFPKNDIHLQHPPYVFVKESNTLCVKPRTKISLLIGDPIPASIVDAHQLRVRVFLTFEADTFKNEAVKRCAKHKDKENFGDWNLLSDDLNVKRCIISNRQVLEFAYPKDDDKPNLGLSIYCESSCHGRHNYKLNVLLISGETLVAKQGCAVKVCTSPSRDSKKYSPCIASVGTQFRQKRRAPITNPELPSKRYCSESNKENIPPEDEAETDDDYKVYVTYTIGLKNTRAVKELAKLHSIDDRRNLRSVKNNNCHTTQLTGESSINAWLTLLNLPAYIPLLESRGFTTMEDIRRKFNKEFFASIGFEGANLRIVNESFVNWLSVYEYSLLFE